MVNFQDMIISLENLGLSSVLLPFLLVFTVVFAALRQSKVLGDEKKLHVIIAMVMAFAVVIPHVLGKYPPGRDIVVMMNTALPQVSIVLIAILMVLIMLGMFAPDIDLLGSNIGGWAVILSIASVAIIFANAAGWFQLPGWLSFLRDSATRSLIIIILIFGIIIAFITSEPSSNKDGGFSKAVQDLGRSMRKSK
jgi:ascorbate-specific PTS system EIIC-type component UlaA